MSLRQAIPGELLSSIARFRFAYRSHPEPKPSVRLLKNSERLPSQNSTVSAFGVHHRGFQHRMAKDLLEFIPLVIRNGLCTRLPL